MHSCMSHIQTTQDMFNLLKGPDPSYPVYNMVTICSAGTEIWPKVCFYILTLTFYILFLYSDLERSRSSLRSIFSIQIFPLPMSIFVKFQGHRSNQIAPSDSLTLKIYI